VHAIVLDYRSSVVQVELGTSNGLEKDNCIRNGSVAIGKAKVGRSKQNDCNNVYKRKNSMYNGEKVHHEQEYTAEGHGSSRILFGSFSALRGVIS
jgi:hypothetical protein